MKTMKVSVVEAKLAMGSDFSAQPIEVLNPGKPSKKDGHTYARIKLKNDRLVTNYDITSLAAYCCANPQTSICVDHDTNQPLTTEKDFLNSKGFYIPENVAIGQANGQPHIAILS